MSNGENSQASSMLLSIIDIKQEVIEDDTPPGYTPFMDQNYQGRVTGQPDLGGEGRCPKIPRHPCWDMEMS
jgi:hypothetical protein